MKICFYRSVATLMLLTICITISLAQTSRGTVSGTVKDPNGAVIPSANVTLVSETTTVERSTTTNDEGLYRFEAVDPGTYSVHVSAPNFITALQSSVTVAANQTATIDAALQIEALHFYSTFIA